MKIIKIKCCRECSYYNFDDEGRCLLTKLYENKLIKNIESIPKWCPLPDYKEGS